MNEGQVLDRVKEFARMTEAMPGYYETHLLPTMQEGATWCKRMNMYYSLPVKVACLLHDCGYHFSKDWKTHREAGAEEARKFLKKLGMGGDDIGLVCRCILEHDGNLKDDSPLECKIVNDADIIAYYKHLRDAVKRSMAAGTPKEEAKRAHLEHAKMHLNDLCIEGMKKYAMRYYQLSVQRVEAM